MYHSGEQKKGSSWEIPSDAGPHRTRRFAGDDIQLRPGETCNEALFIRNEAKFRSPAARRLIVSPARDRRLEGRNCCNRHGTVSDARLLGMVGMSELPTHPS